MLSYAGEKPNCSIFQGATEHSLNTVLRTVMSLNSSLQGDFTPSLLPLSCQMSMIRLSIHLGGFLHCNKLA